MQLHLLIMTLSNELASTSMHLQGTYEAHRQKEKEYENTKNILENEIQLKNKEIEMKNKEIEMKNKEIEMKNKEIEQLKDNMLLMSMLLGLPSTDEKKEASCYTV